MAARSKHILESFVSELSNKVKGFSDIPVKYKFNLAWHIFEHGIKSREHHKFAGHMSIHHLQLEKEFGRANFHIINDDLELFEKTQWSVKKKLTRGFKPTAKVQAIKDRYLRVNNIKPSRLLDGTGRVMKTIPRAILSQNSTGQTDCTWSGAVIKNQIKVDLVALKRLQRKLKSKIKNTPPIDIFTSNEDIKAHDKANRTLEGAGKIIRMANVDLVGRGVIIQHYSPAQSGRIYGVGTSLQNIPRAVRAAALNGLNLYDIENCHYSIVAQLASRHGYRCEAIGHYLTHKKEVRKQLAGDIGLSIDDVKMALTAIIYGAPASSSSWCAIPQKIGSEKSKLFFEHELVKSINAELNEARGIILNGWSKVRGKITNDLGKKIDASEEDKKLLAHILQGIEAKALREVIRLHPDSIELALHDGFVTKDTINIPLIEEAIFQSTGFRLTWSPDFIVEIEP